MNIFNTILQKKLVLEAQENALLAKMAAVDWENLPVDTLVLTSGCLSDFSDNKANPSYFAGVSKEGKVVTFSSGRTSTTTQGLYEPKYCLPKDEL